MDQVYINARRLLASGQRREALVILEMITLSRADQQLREFAQDDINHAHGFNVKRFNELMATAPQ